METYSEFRKVVEELIATQNKLAQVDHPESVLTPDGKTIIKNWLFK